MEAPVGTLGRRAFLGKRAEELRAYAPMHEAARERTKNNKPGDPAATAAAMLKLVDAEKPPLRLFLGSMPLQIARQRYEERLKTWESWADVSEAAQGNLAAAGKP